MFLTRFEINRRRRGAIKLLGSPQAMHAAVMAAYPSDARTADARAEARVLWRVDDSPTGLFLYVVGPSKPDLTHLVEQAGWPTTKSWDTRDYDGFLDSLSADQLWSFRLVTNPTKSTKVGGRERSQRVAHVTAAQQLAWLMDRSTSLGFDIPLAEGEPQAAVTWRELSSFRRGHSQVTLSRCRVDGMLRVTDPDALRATLRQGVGPAKAYGCGLMTLAPPQ